MKHNLYLYCFIALLILFIPNQGFSTLSYEVEFCGVDDTKTKELLQSASDLVRLQDRPPTTQAMLNRRAEADIPQLIKVMHSLAYYNAKIDVKIDFKSIPIVVRFLITPGLIYPFKAFKIQFAKPEILKESMTPDLLDHIQAADLGVGIGCTAYPKTIIEAKETLLCLLARRGFPFACISKTEVFADQTAKDISVVLTVDSGPQVCFGPIKVTGNRRVKTRFFNKKIRWEEGALYDTKRVEETQNAIEASRLFSSVVITPEKPENPNDHLAPMVIEVTEGKHHSIGLGASFTTQRGSGATADWENRNFRGVGEKLSFHANLWQETQEVSLLFVKPDFRCRGQEFHGLLEYQYETTKGYTESSFSVSGTIERRVNNRLWLSYGSMFKQLSNTRSDHNGSYHLIKFPLQLRWTTVDSLLDPTKGHSIYYRLIPTLQVLKPQFAYATTTLTGTIYHALNHSGSIVLAAKGTFGTIQGSPRRTIPPSERFYAGSETTLRGYAYRTVSPLNDKHKPIGGRSMMVYSLETRVHATKDFGWVGFYDFGNVYASPLPELKHKFLHAVGMGLRYYTPVGPLRLDVAFPLNRRKHVDSAYQIYLSVGQAF
ncbi:autotransporter assembly complex protein TamA [Parachlamydia acanthamoebae]|uniref:autotransporter assembly complex protein TamA n=1 Tax=Parachlamydia acanthamoebae TaxID=83552 RepID=UPI000750AB34|nr:BamA/TamA family outer membrane protein [Parachlamydia acanthamoebae]